MSTPITEAKDVFKFVTTLCSFCIAFVHWYFGICAVPQKRQKHAEMLSFSLRLAVAFSVIMQMQPQIRMLKSFFHHFYKCTFKG